MSFGRPPTFSDFTATPPDRGSFPLDHYGECKDQMTAYLSCLRKEGANSTPCRIQGKGYLECRMAKGLMERDEWQNLGMGTVSDANGQTDAMKTTQSPPVPPGSSKAS